MISLADKALEFVKKRGYVLTKDIVNEFKVSSVIAGAILSQLVSRGLISVSHLKVGSGPVYYIPSQKSKLEAFSGYLKGIEKEAFELLKQHKIIKDSELTPALRVALSNIQDFATLIEVVTPNGVSEKYWKFYNLTNEDIKRILSEQQTNSKSARNLNSSQPNKIEPDSESPKLNINQQSEPEKQQILVEPKPDKSTPTSLETNSQKDTSPMQKGFLLKVFNFFDENNITVLSSNIIKKDKEAEFVISYESPLGIITFYAYCVDKKRVSDKDLSLAYMEALNKRLTLVFITSGEFTKKCKELLLTKFKGVVVKKL